eukprot:488722-Rhodomonas_salina.5
MIWWPFGVGYQSRAQNVDLAPSQRLKTPFGTPLSAPFFYNELWSSPRGSVGFRTWLFPVLLLGASP